MKKASPWKLAAVSVRGFSHEEKDEPCQDAHDARATRNGWLIAVTADGAGSTRYGGDGAKIACRGVLDRLEKKVARSGLLKPRPPSDTEIRRWIATAIADMRMDLAAAAKNQSSSMNEFHATLVGCLVRPSGAGLFFHIGDGAGCALSSAEPAKFVISAPENGAYAETTYFVTEDHWREHLRFAEFSPDHDQLLLMSDGVTSMALKGSMRALEPAMAFIEPICRYLIANDRGASEMALAATLASDRVREITGDDKTLVWAMKGG